MDLLRTVVVDITTMLAACQALKSVSGTTDSEIQGKSRGQLRRELKRGTVAYIDTLARTKRGLVDEALISACRIAAERHMTRAIERQQALGRLVSSEPGSLEGLAAARQDLWRLAHITVYLRAGSTALRDPGDSTIPGPAASVVASLRRRLRKALVAYAKATLGGKQQGARPLAASRQSALAEIGKRGVEEAKQLSMIEAAHKPDSDIIRRGVSKPVADLFLDWQRGLPASTEPGV